MTARAAVLPVDNGLSASLSELADAFARYAEVPSIVMCQEACIRMAAVLAQLEIQAESLEIACGIPAGVKPN